MNFKESSEIFETHSQSSRCCDAEDNIMIITYSFCGFVITIDLLLSSSITVEDTRPFFLNPYACGYFVTRPYNTKKYWLRSTQQIC
jgi:hypothetical protein